MIFNPVPFKENPVNAVNSPPRFGRTMEEGCILVTLVEPSDYGCLALVDILDLKPIVDGNVCLGKVLMENFRQTSIKKHLSSLAF
ncbi:hypothetical protein AAC387_Pa03g1150 [Persea americana]